MQLTNKLLNEFGKQIMKKINKFELEFKKIERADKWKRIFRVRNKLK
jgi:hypothetical protein